MKGFLVPVGICLATSLICLHAGWQDSLTPDSAGSFPSVRSFEADFRIGWMDIEAGHAHAKITNIAGQPLRLEGTGASTGLARILWQLDASLESTTARNGFQTIYTVQQENYAHRAITTQIVARQDGIWRLRENIPSGENPARWKKIKISPVRDIFSGMLFLRSQNLALGHSVSAIIFPGDSPFLVELRAVEIAPLTIAGITRDAVRLDLHIQTINIKKNASLEPHKKFRTGTVWLSNDMDRIPLRIELQLFIGYVFAELESLTFSAP